MSDITWASGENGSTGTEALYEHGGVGSDLALHASVTAETVVVDRVYLMTTSANNMSHRNGSSKPGND